MSAEIGFIGAGKMGAALIGGLIAKGVFPREGIVACARSAATAT